MVFAGHDLIAENGALLAETSPFEGGWAETELDCQRMESERARNTSFEPSTEGYQTVEFDLALTDAVLAVAVANLPGLGFEVNGVVLPVVLVWYIFTELGSIAENAAAMGAPVPGWLVRILAQGKEGAKK